MKRAASKSVETLAGALKAEDDQAQLSASSRAQPVSPAAMDASHDVDAQNNVDADIQIAGEAGKQLGRCRIV